MQEDGNMVHEVCGIDCQIGGAFGGGLVMGLALGFVSVLVLRGLRFATITSNAMTWAIAASIVLCTLVEYFFVWKVPLAFNTRLALEMVVVAPTAYVIAKVFSPKT